MIPLDIAIHALGDPKLWPEIKPKAELQLRKVGILEHGTAGGQTSLCLVLQDVDGNYFVAQTIANLFHMVNGVLSGAEARFAERRSRQ